MTHEARAALREKVARAIAETQDEDWENPALFLVDANDTAESGREAYRDMADAAIDLALEEAAQRVWRFSEDGKFADARDTDLCNHLAAAIRAMKGKATSPESGAPDADQSPATR
jgi:hypothetical protein